MIVFSTIFWEGDYSSRDIPGGVEHSPHTNAVYLICADGTGLRRLDNLVQNAQAPCFSPDGRWVYFQSNAAGAWNIYRCRVDGGIPENLTGGRSLGKDSFGIGISPDGRRVLFVCNDGQIGRVAIMDADGSNPRIVAPGIGYHYMASFSPDGRRIVFSHTAEGYRLKVMDLRGEGIVTLTPDHPESFVGQFTPDGKTIVFFRRGGDIYSVGSDGGGLRRLTEGNQYGEFKLTANDRHGSSDPPDISPDGVRIAYCARVSGVPQVHVMSLDGSGQRRLTDLPGACGRVKWSRDGKRMAFVSFVGQYPQLHVMGADGRCPQRLTDLNGAVYFINWGPEP